VCAATGMGATATLLAAHTCNTRFGPFLGSEPSLFADYVAADNGKSTASLAKAGHVFGTWAPGSVAFNFSESPPAAGREIEISRIDLRPMAQNTGKITMGDVELEPAHQLHDMRLVHGERVYGVFSDTTHFEVPTGAADFFSVGKDGNTQHQQFQSNTAPLTGTFDNMNGTLSLHLVIGDPKNDGAEVSFLGAFTRKPSYDCFAGIPPVFAPLQTIVVEPCYEGAPIAVPLPHVTDLCTPHDIDVSGLVISVNGNPVTPIPIVNGLVILPSGVAVIRWTATDGNGTTAAALQTVIVRSKPALFAAGKLEIDNDASVRTPSGAGATLDNRGSNSNTDDTKLHHGAVSGSVLSVPGVKLIGSTVLGNVQSGSTVDQVGGAVVQGQVISNMSPQLPVFPTLSPTFPPTSGDVNALAGTTVLSPGSYNNVVVNSGATLALSAGTYYFTTATISGTINLDTNKGSVRVFVKASMAYSGAINSNGAPSHFLVGYVGSQPLQLQTAFAGILIAPNAKLQLGTAKVQTYRGAFFANEIRVFQGVQITQSPFACTVQ